MLPRRDVVGVDEDDVNRWGCSHYKMARNDHVVKQLPIRVIPEKEPIAVQCAHVGSGEIIR